MQQAIKQMAEIMLYFRDFPELLKGTQRNRFILITVHK